MMNCELLNLMNYDVKGVDFLIVMERWIVNYVSELWLLLLD
jgi:hypothetical protein